MLGWAMAAWAGSEWNHQEPLPPGDESPASFTIAPLIVRKDERLVGATGEDLRVALLEHAREKGWPVLGAENLLFGKDDSGNANFVLGGEIEEVYETKWNGTKGLAVDLRWELLDRRADVVIYTVETRGFVAGLPAQDTAHQLLVIALDNLLARPKFLAALAPAPARTDPQGALTLASCTTALSGKLPGTFEQVLPAVVSVRQGAASGSGVVVSPDGFVWTAAHVISGRDRIEIKLPSGPSLEAVVVRADAYSDAALLKVQGSAFPCVQVASASPNIGEEVFLVGSPLGTDLQGSVSRGVVSGHRVIDGVPVLQTDAAASPGSSGGPLLDSDGRLVGVMSAKRVGHAVEGLAFAVPPSVWSDKLSVQFAEQSMATVPAEGLQLPAAVVDEPDPPIVPVFTPVESPITAALCVYRLDKAGTPLEIGDKEVALARGQYACVSLPAGPQVVRRGAGPLNRYEVSLRSGERAYLEVAPTGFRQVTGQQFEKRVAKGLSEVKI